MGAFRATTFERQTACLMECYATPWPLWIIFIIKNCWWALKRGKNRLWGWQKILNGFTLKKTGLQLVKKPVESPFWSLKTAEEKRKSKTELQKTDHILANGAYNIRLWCIFCLQVVLRSSQSMVLQSTLQPSALNGTRHMIKITFWLLLQQTKNINHFKTTC